MAKLVQVGEITEEEERNHPAKPIVTSVIGQEEVLDTKIVFYQTKRRELFILCSDGLSDMVDGTRMSEIALQNRGIKMICSDLINAALEAKTI